MGDALFVGGFETVGDLAADVEGVLQRQRPLGDAGFEAFALDQGHRQEGLAIGLADFVDRADVGMIESGGGLGFAKETGFGLVVAKQVRRQELQRDGALEARVLGLVDDAHAALAELFEDLVVTDGLADQDSSIVPAGSGTAHR